MIKAAKKTNVASTSNDAYTPLYTNVPAFNCNMSQIENFCIDRFNLLNEILSLKDTSLKQATTSDQHDFYELSKKYLGSQKEEIFKIKDELSHYCLRIAMCDSEDRDWFITSELALLKHRLPNDLTHFITTYSDFGWYPVSEDEYKLLADDLDYLVVKSNLKLQDPIGPTHFYKIPFQDIPNLIDLKKVIIKKGYAFVFRSNFKDLIANTYKNYLEFAMDRVKIDKNRIREEFPELIQFFKTLPRAGELGLNKQFLKSTQIRKEDVLPLSKSSFPLCMRVMHDSLIGNAKLKHEGRLQFSTYLKGIGLPFEEAIQFWKMAFSRRVSNNEFDKEYAYTLRHTYGLEGKAVSYHPYSCSKIIAKIPSGIDQVHGCPYLWDTEKLANKLEEIGISEFERIQLIESSKVQPNIACTKHFNILHPSNNFSKVISHPNQFFEASRLYHKKLEDSKKIKKEENEKDK
ncbi:hypothetical protein DICPUDRAFT_81203 [Dictyostelium purpureum]|uniref:DNA primase large subunit C-terminal domain-containing protein n=1 Tax=Dictyostelium purpureum TaxID=5786 RepID=F0ZST1_DICPU|nr:uncharacterized protein DICPUDRAFT_81203 [Dictyostelium purpureum]EGC33000.1 hypothetical protein DICPUDRAFT_81203 [Dictyostelium purpureum]|eukprot:XP_003290470.1 hypothetical protein DICPUDRAFT_81203 [Dictyostelium purpureum]